MTDSTVNELALTAYRARLDNRVLDERLAKLDTLRSDGPAPFANGFEPTHQAAELFAAHAEHDNDALEALSVEVAVAGRIRFFRRMGKASFIKIQDRSCRPGVKPPWNDEAPNDEFLQLFVSKSAVGDDAFVFSQSLDLGDIVGVRGRLMRTRTGELSVFVTEVVLLTKSTRPLPEKFKGLADVEQRLRQRYVDLIMNDDSREVFLQRIAIVRYIRRYFEDRGFLEVETPMMHVSAGGASARPFVTHHNALYLKRLLVGGLERVFELNRSFRNEGVSRQHNPEFTMLEFYQAYATYEDLMNTTEELVVGIVESVFPREDGSLTTEFDGTEINWSRPWNRVSVADAVRTHTALEGEDVWDVAKLGPHAAKLGIEFPGTVDPGKLMFQIFEAACESTLVQPTFLVDFPAAVSPLARRKDDDSRLTDRFELYACGREIANGFSELNDPEDQYLRFAEQLAAREAGDDEAMPMDEDYVRALEYGMPPAAGEGIGIDRLVMMLTGASSIRDVLFFPHMRPE
ncbi:MAG: lysyl-tRNA synthetase class 2 [Flavobacteriales bacterium]|jgi:lysyl-tRNA synthetase class 2